MKRAIATVAVAALALAGCAAPESTTATTEVSSDSTNDYGLEGMDAVEAIDYLDRMPVAERPDDLMATVGIDALELTPASGERQVIALPDDQTYVSIAPYIDQTHECYYHSLTTCQGEMSQVPIQVRITNEDGTVLVDEETTTFENGFIGYWLPKDTSGTIEISANGRTGTTDFSTTPDGATCVTTLQLV